MMDTTINLDGKDVTVSLTRAAEQNLSNSTGPLLAEMELYFSCLIRKAVRFYDSLTDDAVKVNDKLSIRFRPVMTKHCDLVNDGSAPPLTDFPITHGERYIPHWLKIDFKNGEWSGEFGYSD